MHKLSFDEISDGRHFEALAVAHFRSLPQHKGTNVKYVEVLPAGYGPDGGVDALVHIYANNGIRIARTTYIIQCKFHESNISPDDLGRSSITDLITSRRADAYLLICKKMPTSKLTDYFTDLNSNCRHRYSYLVWSGEEFLERLHEAPDSLIRQFFPLYYAGMKGIEQQTNPTCSS